MPRRRTGTIQRFADGSLRARVTVSTRNGSERVWVKLDPKLSDDEGRAISLRLTEQLAGKVLDDLQLAALRGEKRPTRTVRDFVLRVYLPSRSHLACAHYEPGWWRLHVLPVLGDYDVRTFGPEPLRELVSRLDARVRNPDIKFAWKTASNIWVMVSKFCADLQRSKSDAIRIRSDNPAAAVTGPDRGAETALQWLYPSETLRLLETAELELARFAACCIYLFARPGEVLGLEWSDLDIDNEMVTIHCAVSERTGELRRFTKGKEVRCFPIPTNLLPMLRAMRREQGRLFSRERKRPSFLRQALLDAGVTRPELHRPGAQTIPIRIHDLRATGISYLAMAGYSDEDIRERAGHRDFSTTLLYIRRGKRVSEALGDPFGPLPTRLESSAESSTESPKQLKNLAPAVGLEPVRGGLAGEKCEESDDREARLAPLRGVAGPVLDDSLDEIQLRAALVEHGARATVAQLLWGRS